MKRLTGILLIMAQFGCATIVQSGPDVVVVTSDPPGAEIYLNHSYVGITPSEVKLLRRDDASFEFRKSGYETAIYSRDKVLAGWFIGNLLFANGVIIGVIVDLATHNQGKYSTDPVHVSLIHSSNSDQSALPAAPSSKAPVPK